MDSPQVSTCNIVVSFSLGCKLEIYEIRKIFPSSYKPQNFHGCVVKAYDTTFVLYSNGSGVCLGNKTETEAYACVRRLCQAFKCKVSKYKICNMVGCFSLKNSKMLLDVMAGKNLKPKRVRFEPEIYPGLVYHARNGGTVLAYHTGKCIVTGCPDTATRAETVKQFLGNTLLYVYFFMY